MPDLSQVSVRFPVLITLLVAIAAGVWQVASTLVNMSQEMYAIQLDVSYVRNNRWRYEDMVTWCRQTEEKNAKIGWRCADPIKPRPYRRRKRR